MKNDNLINELQEIIKQELEVEVDREDNLKNCGVDSLSLVLIISRIEEFYNVIFLEDDLDPLKLITLNDLASLVRKYR